MHHIMGEPIEVVHLDFRTLTESHFETDLEVVPLEDGFIDSYCLYFRVHLDEQTILTNSPWAPKTHWTQVIYTFPNRREVKKGDPLTVTLKYDGTFHMWYPDEWEGHDVQEQAVEAEEPSEVEEAEET